MRIVNEIKLSQVVHERYKDSVEFVQKWKPGEKIPNPKFLQIKSDVSSAFARATNSRHLDGANEFTVWSAQQNDGEEAFHKYSFPSSVLHVPGYLKRTPKQLKQIKSRRATKMIKAAIVACQPWEEIAEKLKAMKGDVVKRQIGVGKKTNPVPTGVLNKEIEEELEKIGKGFAKDLETNFEDHYHVIIKKYQADAKRVGRTNPHDLYQTKQNYHLNKILGNFLDSEFQRGGGYVYNLKKDYKSIIDKMAKQSAKEAVEGFVLKMKNKLSVIVGSRKIGVDVSGNSNRNTISFEFEDNSKFTVQNSIVLSYSVYGKPFYRYPTTFHNVILPDGKKLNNPSEAKIKKEFAK